MAFAAKYWARGGIGTLTKDSASSSCGQSIILLRNASKANAEKRTSPSAKRAALNAVSKGHNPYRLAHNFSRLAR